MFKGHWVFEGECGRRIWGRSTRMLREKAAAVSGGATQSDSNVRVHPGLLRGSSSSQDRVAAIERLTWVT